MIICTCGFTKYEISHDISKHHGVVDGKDNVPFRPQDGMMTLSAQGIESMSLYRAALQPGLDMLEAVTDGE
jgi:hypothetical protein